LAPKNRVTRTGKAIAFTKEQTEEVLRTLELMATPLLIKPSIEEVKLSGHKIGLPEIECEKFFHYYESNGWRVGKVKMASVNGALAGWKIRWQERQSKNNPPDRPTQEDWRDSCCAP
jgi:hypothetical protein